MSSKLKDKESKSLLENKVFQAGIIVSIILLSSAVFVSQTDRIFGKAAAGTPITGTIVLFDQGGDTGIVTKSFFSKIYLPKASCIAHANYCFGSGSVGTSKCITKQIYNTGDSNMFIIDLKPGNEVGSGCPCGGTYTKQNENTFIYARCRTSAWARSIATASITVEGDNIVSCSADNHCLNCPTTYSSDSITVGGSQGTVYSGFCQPYEHSRASVSVVEYDGELPYPLGHLDVTYVCP